MKIIFVRHGDHKGDKLTRLGKKQSKIVCNDLKYENIEVIYSSPLSRATETAEIISKNLGNIEVKVSDALRERSRLTHEPENAYEIEYSKNYLNPNFSSKNPEGCKEFLDRSYKFLEELCNSDYQCVLIVGHSSFVYALLSFVQGKRCDRDITWVRVGNCSKICFEIKN